MKRFSVIYFLMPLLALCCGGTMHAQQSEADMRQSLSVERCVELSLGGSMELRNAQLDVVAARLQKQEAFAEYFPSLSAGALAFHSLHPMIDISVVDIVGRSDMGYLLQSSLEDMAAPYGLSTHYRAMQYGYSGMLTLSQPVYAGGRVVTGNALASLGVEAAKVKNSLQRRQSEESVRKLFYQVLSLQRKQESLETTASLLESLCADVRAAVDAGLALETDLIAVQLKLSELKAGRSKLDMGLRIAKMNLLNTVGLKYNAYRSVQSEYPYIDSFVLEGDLCDVITPDQAYTDEEKVAFEMDEATLLQMQVDAKKLEKRMILGEALPSVVLGASYGYSRLVTQPKFNGAMYAVLQIPITDWGKNSRRIKRQGIEIQKAENQRDFYRSQLVLQMRQLYMELCAAYDNMQLSRESEALSSRRLEQMRASYAAGLCTVSDVLMAQNDQSQAMENYINACSDYVSALESYRLRIK